MNKYRWNFMQLARGIQSPCFKPLRRFGCYLLSATSTEQAADLNTAEFATLESNNRFGRSVAGLEGPSRPPLEGDLRAHDV